MEPMIPSTPSTSSASSAASSSTAASSAPSIGSVATPTPTGRKAQAIARAEREQQENMEKRIEIVRATSAQDLLATLDAERKEFGEPSLRPEEAGLLLQYQDDLALLGQKGLTAGPESLSSRWTKVGEFELDGSEVNENGKRVATESASNANGFWVYIRFMEYKGEELERAAKMYEARHPGDTPWARVLASESRKVGQNLCWIKYAGATTRDPSVRIKEDGQDAQKGTRIRRWMNLCSSGKGWTVMALRLAPCSPMEWRARMDLQNLERGLVAMTSPCLNSARGGHRHLIAAIQAPRLAAIDQWSQMHPHMDDLKRKIRLHLSQALLLFDQEAPPTSTAMEMITADALCISTLPNPQGHLVVPSLTITLYCTIEALKTSTDLLAFAGTWTGRGPRVTLDCRAMVVGASRDEPLEHWFGPRVDLWQLVVSQRRKWLALALMLRYLCLVHPVVVRACLAEATEPLLTGKGIQLFSPGKIDEAKAFVRLELPQNLKSIIAAEHRVEADERPRPSSHWIDRVGEPVIVRYGPEGHYSSIVVPQYEGGIVKYSPQKERHLARILVASEAAAAVCDEVVADRVRTAAPPQDQDGRYGWLVEALGMIKAVLDERGITTRLRQAKADYNDLGLALGRSNAESFAMLRKQAVEDGRGEDFEKRLVAAAAHARDQRDRTFTLGAPGSVERQRQVDEIMQKHAQARAAGLVLKSESLVKIHLPDKENKEWLMYLAEGLDLTLAAQAANHHPTLDMTEEQKLEFGRAQFATSNDRNRGVITTIWMSADIGPRLVEAATTAWTKITVYVMRCSHCGTGAVTSINGQHQCPMANLEQVSRSTLKICVVHYAHDAVMLSHELGRLDAVQEAGLLQQHGLVWRRAVDVLKQDTVLPAQFLAKLLGHPHAGTVRVLVHPKSSPAHIIAAAATQLAALFPGIAGFTDPTDTSDVLTPSWGGALVKQMQKGPVYAVTCSQCNYYGLKTKAVQHRCRDGERPMARPNGPPARNFFDLPAVAKDVLIRAYLRAEETRGSVLGQSAKVLRDCLQWSV